MLRGLRDWLHRTFAAKPPPTPEESRRAAEQARHDRAASIVELRREVRRLQQEIKDVSDLLDGGIAGHERAVHERRLAAFQQQLERTQADLDRLQARV
jgi:hypothetical protein